MFFCFSIALFNYIVEHSETDVNFFDDKGQTPLLLAVQKQDCYMAHTLIEKGADINATDNNMNSPLHFAVSCSTFEMVAMLLYYGADASSANKYGDSPFTVAILREHTEMQRLLIEYETDFNRKTSYEYNIFAGIRMLELAIRKKSPTICEIIERGAKVSAKEMLLASYARLGNRTYKYLWSKYKCSNDDERFAVLENFVHLIRTNSVASKMLEFCSIIFYSPVAGELILNDEETDLLPCLISSFYDYGLSEDDLFPFICVCLSWGVTPYLSDVAEIYDKYGYNETLKLFLHVGVKIEYPVQSVFLQLICDVTKDTKEILGTYQPSLTALEITKILEYFAWPQTYIKRRGFHKYRNMFIKTRFPSLIELSREACREAVRTKYNVSNSSQFYTVLNYLPVAEFFKEIIGYKVPLYRTTIREEIIRDLSKNS